MRTECGTVLTKCEARALRAYVDGDAFEMSDLETALAKLDQVLGRRAG